MRTDARSEWEAIFVDERPEIQRLVAQWRAANKTESDWYNAKIALLYERHNRALTAAADRLRRQYRKAMKA